MKGWIAPGSLPHLLLRLFGHLSPRRQRQFALLMGLILVNAFSEAS